MSVFMIMTFLIYNFMVQPSNSDVNNYFAVLPETVTAQTGSCLQIPCTFNLSDFTQKLNKTKHIHGIWQTGETPQTLATAFNSSSNITGGSSKVQMTGNLYERNCTTVFYNISESQTGFYYFRLEMEPDVFKATFNAREKNPNTTVFKPVKINITDLPVRPKIQLIRGEQTVMEGSTVTLGCSAEAPCPQQSPNISWSNVPESANIKPQRREIKPDQTQSVFSEMTFTASCVDHERNISCTVTYPRPTSTDTVDETMMLRVSCRNMLPLIFGYSGGALILILFAGICIFCTRKKSQTEDQTGNKNAATFCQSDEVISSTENETDELNYGEINFSNLQYEQRKAEREPEASVYSEIQVHDRNKPSSNDMEDVYAHVKKK